MSNVLRSEEDVKNALGIETWRNLSKEKIMSFISILPNVDNEVAVKIIEQFPEFVKASNEMIHVMKDLCENAIKDASENTKISIKAYEKVLDELSVLVERDDISSEDRKYFSDKMIEIADKIGKKDTEDKQFKAKILNNIGGIMFTTLVIGASLLGVKHLDAVKINDVGDGAKKLLDIKK